MKHVVITGATRGLGRAMAIGFAAYGWTVAGSPHGLTVSLGITKGPCSKFAQRFFHSTLGIMLAASSAIAAPSAGRQSNIVSSTADSGGIPLVQYRQAGPIYLDKSDHTGVLRAGADLQAYIERVTSMNPLNLCRRYGSF